MNKIYSDEFYKALAEDYDDKEVTLPSIHASVSVFNTQNFEPINGTIKIINPKDKN